MKEEEIKHCTFDLINQKFPLTGRQMQDVEGLFPRIVEEKKPAAAVVVKAEEKVEKKKVKVESASSEPIPGVITIDEFFKATLKTAKVIAAERVEGADKLLRLQIEIGSENRQIVAGVAKYYTPEEMVGRIIVVVANLKPCKIRGIESQGMLLAAKAGDKLVLVTTAGEIESAVD